MTSPTPSALAEQFGVAVAGSLTIYLPAIRRLAMDELVAFAQSLSVKDYDAAYKTVAAKMTLEDLAAEKAALASLAELRATARAEAVALSDKIGLAILQAALGVVLSAGLL